jgi:SAM-dependent methyltransferase
MVTRCRICGSSNLFEFLDLGFTPPADQFLREDQLRHPETHYPLAVLMCEDCSLAQLNHIVPAEVLYRRDYPYESSMTKSGQLHWDEFAESVSKSYGIGEGDLVVDIGSNVGVLLGSFAKQGANTLGIDPASNIVRIAEKRGIETWDEFFSPRIAEKAVRAKGNATIITATNVFAHVDDLKSFMEAVDILLAKDGIFIFEAPYFGNLINFLEYDTIYHEHLSYLLLEPIIVLATKFGMEVVDVIERDIHGGSFRVFISRKGSRPVQERVNKFLEKEKAGRWKCPKTLQAFSKKVEQNRRELTTLLHSLISDGNRVAAVSAPAKGMTLLNYCRIGPETLSFVTEKSTLKMGRYCPGVHIPVLDDDALISHQIDYALLLAWNFAEEIMNNLKEFREGGGKFIIPIPHPKILD